MRGETLLLPVPTRYRFRFRALGSISLPSFPGSAWRGLLGHGLRRIACVTRAERCDGCLLLESCIHGRFFESKVANPSDARYRFRPHPFVLDVQPGEERTLSRGEPLELGITLLGGAGEELPYLVQAMRHAGEMGIGKGKGRFELVALLREAPLGSDRWLTVSGGQRVNGSTGLETGSFPQMPQRILVRHQSPLRMKRRGKLVGPAEFDAALFLQQLWRRVNEIGRFSSSQEAGLELVLPKERPDGIRAVDKRVFWKEWRRYSSRQGTSMQMGGLMGEWTLEDGSLREWWPLLWYGQWVHLGKATSMGLGAYRLHGADDKLVKPAQGRQNL